MFKGSFSRRVVARRLGACFAVSALAALSFASPGAQAQDAPRTPDRVWTYINSLPAAERRAVLEREAAKESGIVIYGATGLDRGQFWVGEFNKRYPNLKAEFVRLLEPDLVQKVTAEARAGQSQADVILLTTSFMPLVRQVFAPYQAGVHAEFDPRFVYGKPSDGWTAYVYEVFPEAMAWRSDRVKADDVPKTLEALADAKPKLNIGTTPNMARLATGFVESYGDAKAQALLEKLAGLGNKVYPSHAALADALASGEVDLAWYLIASRPIALKAKGAPIDWRLMDPLYGESNAISLVKTAKSPYTAALFMDTMLSKEALEASDKWESGRIYGNKTGKYELSINDFPSLVLFPVVETNDLRKWQLLGERLFIRRQ